MKNIFSDGYFTGINYWGSKAAINMWSEFDEESIERDMQVLAEVGITHLRVFPLWPVFQPLSAIYVPSGVYEYTFGEDPLPDTPAGRAGVSEEALGKFERFVRIAERYGMKLIVALITGHMSYRTYAPPAFEGKALLSDPTVIKWQRRFVKCFVGRFKDEAAIIGWDLGNESDCMPGLTENKDTFYVWSSVIADAVKSIDRSRPVISGLAHAEIDKDHVSLKELGELCDVHTEHPYNIFRTPTSPLCTVRSLLDPVIRVRIAEDIGGIPTFVQEFGAIGYLNCSRKTEAEYYRAALLASLAHGAHGAMWWCAFDQGHHAYAPYRWNSIGSNYGFFDKDLEPKPIAEENKAFHKRLSLIPGRELPKHRIDGVILLPREEEIDHEYLAAPFVIAKQANLDLAYSYALDPIPDAPLYIIPSVKNNKSIPKGRLDELLRKVLEGSVLYICADTGLMRDIPEITGVNIAYREYVNAPKTLRIAGGEMQINTTYFYKPESYDAEVIATDEDGEGVLFKHSYGKGFVYLMTLQLERHFAKAPHLYHKLSTLDHTLVYRELARCAGIERICDTDTLYVRFTEHPIDARSSYVFAINYHNEPVCAELKFSDEYEVKTVFGAEIENKTLHLRENDGALMIFTRK